MAGSSPCTLPPLGPCSESLTSHFFTSPLFLHVETLKHLLFSHCYINPEVHMEGGPNHPCILHTIQIS